MQRQALEVKEQAVLNKYNVSSLAELKEKDPARYEEAVGQVSMCAPHSSLRDPQHTNLILP